MSPKNNRLCEEERPSPKRFKYALVHACCSVAALIEYRLNYADTIYVLVGESEEPFTVHRSLISHKSPFFQAACRKVRKEGQENHVKLPKIAPYVFSVYVNWVYTNEIDLDVVEKHEVTYLEDGQAWTFQAKEYEYMESHLCFQLYIAADSFMDNAFLNRIMDKLVELSLDDYSLMGDRSVALLWSETAPSCAARRFVLDVITKMIRDAKADIASTLRKLKIHLPADFWFDLVLHQAESPKTNEKEKPLGILDKCRYHRHGDGDFCPSTTGSN